MKQTTAPLKTPSPANNAKGQPTGIDQNAVRRMFMGAVLDLTWQMAIAVLVPIIGGYELDKNLKTSPAFTVLGFVVAMFATFLIIRRSLYKYDNRTLSGLKGSK